VNSLLITAATEVDRLPAHRLHGRVTGVLGVTVEVLGLVHALAIGARCEILLRDGKRTLCEVVGFRERKSLLMPLGPLEGIGLGCKVELVQNEAVVWPSDLWLGRVVDALGNPLDGKGPLSPGDRPRPLLGGLRQPIGAEGSAINSIWVSGP
jgi:flagellum-specific ATP synthase